MFTGFSKTLFKACKSFQGLFQYLQNIQVKVLLYLNFNDLGKVYTTFQTFKKIYIGTEIYKNYSECLGLIIKTLSSSTLGSTG